MYADMPDCPNRFMIDGTIEGFESWEQATKALPKTRIADESPGIDMLYSSGTTGRPKGALGKNTKGGKKKDLNKPKRSTSAYFFFLAHCRQEAAKAGNYPSKVTQH